jgi:hypothetical protein
MSSEAASYFAEGLTSSSEDRWSVQGARVRHLKTRHIRSHAKVLRDAQRFIIELSVNPHLRTHNILVNAARNQCQMAYISAYNVANKDQDNPESRRKHNCAISKVGVL